MRPSRHSYMMRTGLLASDEGTSMLARTGLALAAVPLLALGVAAVAPSPAEARVGVFVGGFYSFPGYYYPPAYYYPYAYSYYYPPNYYYPPAYTYPPPPATYPPAPSAPPPPPAPARYGSPPAPPPAAA